MAEAWHPEWGPRRPPGRRRWRRRAKRVVAEIAALGRSPSNAARGVAILAYHGTGGHRGHPWWLDFAGQMSLIEDLGYEVVSLSRVVEILRGTEPPSRPTLAITFDDGFANNLEHAYPELARRGWPATVFIAICFLGRRPYLLEEELPDLDRLGIEVGNHTMTHPDLRQASSDTVTREIRECGDRLEQLTGRRPRHFCYPNGRYAPHSREAVASTDVVSACSGRVGFNGPGQDPFLLRRLTLEQGEGPRALKLRLAGGYDFQDYRQRRMDREA